MSERKVLNKYYPPDFDPSKIPKLRLPRNRQYSIRIMAPFNMRCDTCGEYIYKGKKFNSRKETVENEDYLGLKIFRFYIKCPRCVSEIAFKTDLKHTDYTLEAGATRNFEAAKLAEEMEERSRKEKEEEELNNPMKVLENRTKASRQEMEQIDALEELRDLNNRHATVDHETMLKLHTAYEEQLLKLQQEEDEQLIKSIFGNGNSNTVHRLDDEVDKVTEPPSKKPCLGDLPTDILMVDGLVRNKPIWSQMDGPVKIKPVWSQMDGPVKIKPVWSQSVGLLSSKKLLPMLVKRKNDSIKPESSNQSKSTCEQSKSTGKKLPKGSEGHRELLSDCNNPAKQCVKSVQDNTNVISGNKTNVSVNTKITAVLSQPTSALGLLGTYSDSDSDT